MPITLPHDLSTKVIVSGAEIQANLQAIVDAHAAGHTTADLNAAAGITLAQLAASYEHLDVNLKVSAQDLDPVLASGWPAATLVTFVPVVGITGSTPWVATDVYWVCSDIGGGTGTFKVLWGTHAELVAGNGDNPGGTITINATQGAVTGLTTTLPVAGIATPQALGIYAVAADLAAMDTLSLNFLSVTVRLRRQISTG